GIEGDLDCGGGGGAESFTAQTQETYPTAGQRHPRQELAGGVVKLLGDIARGSERAGAGQRGEIRQADLDRDPGSEQFCTAQPCGTAMCLVQQHGIEQPAVGDVLGEGLLVADGLLPAYRLHRPWVEPPGKVVQVLAAGPAEG